MQSAAARIASRQRYVDGFVGKPRIERCVVEGALARRQCLADGIAYPVDRFAR
jgi:hypothetical protein